MSRHKNQNQTSIPMPNIQPEDSPVVVAPVEVAPVVAVLTATEAMARSLAALAENDAVKAALASAKLAVVSKARHSQAGLITVLKPGYLHKPGSLSFAAFELCKAYDGKPVSDCLKAGAALGMNPGYFFGNSGWIRRGIVSVSE